MKQCIYPKGKAQIIGIFMLLSAYSPLIAENYISVKIKSGDGLYSLFRRYQLPANSCNINQFKQINQLKDINKLLLDRTYRLPVLLMPFNGKSVSTSVPGIDKSTVVRIINYNKTVYTNKLRKLPYNQSKLVWIPYHELNCSSGSAMKSSSASVRTTLAVSSAKPASAVKPAASPSVKSVNSKPETVKVENDLESTAETTSNLEPAVSEKAGLRTRTVPLFGPDFKEIRIESELLKNKVFYLVSGHGGPDPGTMYQGQNMTLCEDEYAYDVTLRLARKLMERGATVHMIVQDPNDGIRNNMYLPMDKDEKCITGYPLVLNQRLRLTQTTDAVNDLYRMHRKQGIAEKDQVAIHIHVDSQHKDLRKDVYFYYQEDNKHSLEIARKIQKTLDNKYQDLAGRSYNGTISSRNLFVMRNTIPSTIFMELGNIQNTMDHKRLLISSNRQALAEWIYDGIAGE
ncbi:MAG TPA: N-acetylmuramoyl-L-alanine amidase [Saprospiraceae bacterium]|nr:N-acetylmuramoyl-L-alanine amidase [Saprospiraceae bacterium]HNT21124.1 N-acetylmuramoyl-L-alanine amidase [Saprospiraceae bacterium]